MQENAEVLDLGCGTGLELDFYFKCNPTAKVTGIDLAETDERECFYRQELLRLKSEQGICDDEFYHYDTPLTKMHELQVLNEAGFSFVEIIAEWGATATIKAMKSNCGWK